MSSQEPTSVRLVRFTTTAVGLQHQPKRRRSSTNQDCSTLWSVTALSRVSHLSNSALGTDPSFCVSTLDDVSAARMVLRDTQRALHAKLEEETAAIARAEQVIREAYASRKASFAKAALALRQQHNSLLPIARIPPELLSTVFTFLKDVYPRSRHRIGWLAVTQVCSRWRLIALHQPGLWSDISLSDGYQFATTSLSRTRNAPLSISSDRQASLEIWQLKFLLDNMSRIQVLRVVVFGESLTALTKPAPLLHTLEMCGWHDNGLPDDFLGGCAPALRKLDYLTVGAALPWTSSLLTRLTSLEIEVHNAMHYSDTFNGPDILDGLASIGGLERLNIYSHHDDNFLRAPPTDGRNPRITLAKLARLEVAGRPSQANLLLCRLSVPPQVIFHCTLVCSPKPTHSEVASFLSSALTTIQSHADSASGISNAITCLEIGWDPSQRKHPVTFAARKDEDISEPALNLSFRWQSSAAGIWQELGPIVLTALSSVHLRELTVRHRACEWLESAGHAPGLQRLTVEGNPDIAALCSALRRVSTSPVGDIPLAEPHPHPRCFLPALSILVLADVRLPATSGIAERAEGEPLVDELVRCLVERAEAGCRLDELDVVRCDVDQEWVARLREAVPEMRVTWDEGACERA
ncbi:hypothetical protein FA95DRAFT_1612345 [Auriscalpium vulgare]|uniref:Uncharacterized protein n=1 Tax=Auriscalpium vulgare TaxID=40419 RepID=A0ACB8R7G7_9AGAM|nr:hypothetical protein FA95DRAFT_1612345 [Auriscalpium vulgare]